jgi:hypothetical protein
MDHQEIAEVLAKPISQELLGSSIPARLAYVGADGAPRVIPIGFGWTGEHVVMATVPRSARFGPAAPPPGGAHHRLPGSMATPGAANPRRGACRAVDGVPAAYVEASRKVIPPEHFEGWERGVRALND